MGMLDLFKRPRADAQLACPRDGTGLHKVERDGAAVDRCGKCGGIWFDARELRRIASDAEVERVAAWVRASTMPSGFRCPRCAGDCCESYLEEVRVDTCRVCRGVWLDRPQLDEAVRRVRVARVVRVGAPDLQTFLRRL